MALNSRTKQFRNWHRKATETILKDWYSKK